MKVSPAQIRAIHVLKSKLSMDDGTYREMLAGYGASSSVHLDGADARHLIEVLAGKAAQLGVWRNQPRALKRWDDLGGRPGMATPKQLRMVEAMWSDVSRASDAQAKSDALVVFLSRHFGVTALAWVTQEMVGRIVRTLQAMRETQRKVYGGQPKEVSDAHDEGAVTRGQEQCGDGARGEGHQAGQQGLGGIRPGDSCTDDRAV